MAQAPQYQQGQGTDQLPEGAAAELNAMPNALSADAGAAQVALGAQEAGAQTAQSGSNPPAATGTQQAPTPDSGGGAAPEPHPLDQIPQQNPEAPVDFTPSSEEDQFLFAPGSGNVAGPTAGGSLTAGKIPPPPGVQDWLPSLQQAAADPNAAPQVKALLQLVTFHLSQAG